jgi:hypothetical protein
MAGLSFDFTGRRSHDTTFTRSPTRAPSPLPPLDGTFTEETPRAPVRIPSDEGASTPTPAPAPTPQKRLAMFTEKISASTSSFARGPAQLLPGSRSHSQHPRTDSQLRENAGSPAPLIAPSTSGSGSTKVHSSPSKVRRIHEESLFRSFIICTRPPLVPVQPLFVVISCDMLVGPMRRLQQSLLPCCCWPNITVHHVSFRSVLILDLLWCCTHLYRCARTTQNWSPEKCIAWAALLTYPIMRQISMRVRPQRLSLPQARSPHPISFPAPPVITRGAHCTS